MSPDAQASPSGGPLADLRVLDLADGLGLYCTKLLADLGADVIKIEPPEGSPARRRGPWFEGNESPETSVSWWHYNTNKRSITLDLASPSGQEALRELVKTADVLVEDAPPGAYTAFGLDYPSASRLNSSLIYTSVTAFGQTGPMAHYQASDLTLQALSGFMYRLGYGQDPPNSVPGGISVPQAGAEATVATLVALYERDTSGLGQHVDVSAYEGLAVIDLDALPRFAVEHQVIDRRTQHDVLDRHDPNRNRIWDSSDGKVRWNLHAIVRHPEDWPTMVAWMDSHGMAADLKEPQWGEVHYRLDHFLHISQVIKRFFLSRTARELMVQGQERDFPIMAICELPDLFEMEHLKARGYFRTVEHPDLQRSFTYPGPPYRFETSTWSLKPAPKLGAHTQVVLGATREPSVTAPATATEAAGGRAKPLQGCRVLDFTWAIAGPALTKLLGASGAEVIKVESPQSRSNRGRVSWLVNNNPNKKSIVLNMKHPAARAVARKLVAVSEAVVDNFAPGVMGRFGFSPAELLAINPAIVSLSMPALGSTGPWSHFKGPGNTFSALSGYDALIGYPHREVFDTPLTALGDTGPNPLHGATALLAALHARRALGSGQHIEISQFESTICYLGPLLMDFAVNGHYAGRTGSRVPDAAPHGVYRCAGEDGWCAIAVESDEEWQRFCKAVDRPDWVANPRFLTLEDRKAHEDELDSAVQEWTRLHAARAVMETLQAHHVAAGVVQGIQELVACTQMQHRGFYPELQHADLGALLHENLTFRMSRTPVGVTQAAPRWGEHIDYVLGDVLHLTEAEVNELIVQGAVG